MQKSNGFERCCCTHFPAFGIKPYQCWFGQQLNENARAAELLQHKLDTQIKTYHSLQVVFPESDVA